MKVKVAAKVAFVVAIMIVGSLVANSAAWAVACPSTIATWTTCSFLDKDYTKISTNLPGTTGLAVATPNPGIHTIAFDFGASLPVGTFTIDYKIHITDPSFTFGKASIDTTVPGATTGVTVTKQIFDTTSTGTLLTTLTSLNGIPDGPNQLGSGVTTVEVIETFTVLPGGSLQNATNTYTQVTVPAPASLILLGLGLTGVAVASRRKR